MVTIEIKGPGGTINYPTEVIIKALKEAGLQVEVKDEHPTNNVEECLIETKKRIDNGYIKDWKVVVETIHYPWGG
jgi:hypothetical protein